MVGAGLTELGFGIIFVTPARPEPICSGPDPKRGVFCNIMSGNTEHKLIVALDCRIGHITL